MSARRAGLAAAVLAMLALGVWVVSWHLPDRALDARFAAATCRHVQIDSAAGPVTGAEDLAWDAGRGLLYVSAHDRRARGADGVPARGGIFAIPASALRGPGPVTARVLAAGGDLKGGVRPHGIALTGPALYFINRSYPFGQQQSALWRMDLETGLMRLVSDDPALCAANDLIADETTGVLLTLDRQVCPGTSWREMAFGRPTGRIAHLSGGALTFSGAYRFANGIAGAVPGPAQVAETRAARISGPVTALSVADLPGGPDNLTVGPDGLIAALHPDLLKLALYLGGWRAAAPSRIVRIPPGDGSPIEILFDDPTGAMFPAASVGVIIGGQLVAGSPGAPGLLVCGR